MKKNLKITVIFLIIIFLIISYFLDSKKNTVNKLKSTDNTSIILKNKALENENNKNNKKIIVYITGEVKNPGVYQISANDRLINLVKIAGGFSKDADKEKINLASPVFDGEKIEIPKKYFKSDITFVESSNSYSSNSNKDKININKADQKELEDITGIGPGKAKSIIEYRNNYGYFSSVEDLVNVSGIGDKTLEKIRDEITIR